MLRNNQLAVYSLQQVSDKKMQTEHHKQSTAHIFVV
jgi:hypothetical protein